MLNELFDKASDRICPEGGCYLQTCPVNIMAFMIGDHIRQENPMMIFGDYQLLKKMNKRHGSYKAH